MMEGERPWVVDYLPLVLSRPCIARPAPVHVIMPPKHHAPDTSHITCPCLMLEVSHAPGTNTA